MIQVVKCPSCAAPLEIDDDNFERCDFCGSRVVVSPNNTISPNSFGFEGLLTQAHKLKEILYLARSGRKIEAIKIYRETFGGGLAEAKEAVENLVIGKPINFTNFQMFSVNTPLQNFGGMNSQAGKIAEIQVELRRGNKINAIKIYRETFNVGLKEAKEGVERLETGEGVYFQGNKALQIDSQAVIKTAKVVGWATIISVLAGIIAALIGAGVAIFAVINATKSNNITVSKPIISTKNPNSSQNQTVDGKTSYATEVLRFGGEGIGVGFFKDNRLIAVDGDGRVYSADNRRIQQFDANGKFLTQWQIEENKNLLDIAADRKNRVYVLSSRDLEIYDGSTQQLLSRIERPNYRNLALDTNGKLYAITYNNEFTKLDENGKLLNKGESLSKQLNFKAGNLQSLAIDGLGNFYVYDSQNKYILKFSPDAKFLIRFDNPSDKNKKISNVYDLAVDGKGRVFAAQVNDIHVFDNEGRYIDSFETRQSLGIAFDDKNALWTASRPFVVKYEINQ